MKRYQPIPLVQAGGVQPYAPQGGREPGAALLAMLAGRTFSGFNPMDAQRNMQAASNGPSLLSSLSGVSPPGGGGSWQLTPDQSDRNSEWSRRDWERKHPPRRKRSLGFDDRPQNA